MLKLPLTRTLTGLTICAIGCLLASIAQAQTADFSPPAYTSRTPQEATREGLRWLGMLQPLFEGCHLKPELTQPFTQLRTLMVRTAERRGIATSEEIQRWSQEGAAQGARLVGVSPAGISQTTCQSIASELKNQAPQLQVTVQQLETYLQQHPEPAASSSVKPR